MQLARQLKLTGLGAFPCRLQHDTTRNKWNKQPITVEREHWLVTAHRHIDDPAVNWAGCTVLGLPVPPGVVVIDLDTYLPDCSLESAERILGGPMPWQTAHIQTTIGGGQHFAFRLPEWAVKQGSNIGDKNSGIDTRVAERGFICAGDGYSPANIFGVLRLAHPESLPVLPEFTRGVLEQPDMPEPATQNNLSNSYSDETIAEALKHIDPTERDTWRNIGFALKHHYAENLDAGFQIWDAWSAGKYWPGGKPASYQPTTQIPQWNSFRSTRSDGATITIGTLFHLAIMGGWTPPALFDTSAAFGDGAASLETFNRLVELIMEQGADSRNVQRIMQEIVNSGCNELQAVLLRNELKASLKQAKLLDRDLSAVIDKKVTPQNIGDVIATGVYGKNHTENAQLFLQTFYPENTLIRLSEIWYAFDGKSWVERPDAFIDYQLTMAMSQSRPQKSTVTGTYGIISSMTHVAGATMNESPPNLILFQNGILDLYTGQMMPHDKLYLTTKIMPYDYDPYATAPHWLYFVNEILEGDQERVNLLQEWLGYMLAPSYEHQKIMLFIGPKRSGKSTIGNILAELVGSENYSGASLSSFAEDDFLDSLRNKTVVFSGDTAKNVSRHHIDAVIERLKKISGNDYVDFKRKYKSRMTCRLPSRITLSSNHVPRLFDDSEALSTRLLVLPFDVSFVGRENPYLLDGLLTEIAGIAVWALQGLARLNAQGKFTLPEASKNEMQFIAESYSPLKTFVEAVIDFDKNAEPMSSSDLYEKYRAWALVEQEDKILARKTFISAFRDISRGNGAQYGVHRRGIDTIRGFKGVKVVEFDSITEAAFKPTVVNGGNQA